MTPLTHLLEIARRYRRDLDLARRDPAFILLAHRVARERRVLDATLARLRAEGLWLTSLALANDPFAEVDAADAYAATAGSLLDAADLLRVTEEERREPARSHGYDDYARPVAAE